MSVTCLSIGEDAGIVPLKRIFKYALAKALEHHLLSCKIKSGHHGDYAKHTDKPSIQTGIQSVVFSSNNIVGEQDGKI